MLREREVGGLYAASSRRLSPLPTPLSVREMTPSELEPRARFEQHGNENPNHRSSFPASAIPPSGHPPINGRLTPA